MMNIPTDEARDALVRAFEFAARENLVDQFLDRLGYLRTYGEPETRTRCTLWNSCGSGDQDLDFTVDRVRVDTGTGLPQLDGGGQPDFVPWFNGGLVYHEHTRTWGVHT